MSTLYSPNLYIPVIPIILTNSSFASIDKSTISIDIDYFSIVSSVFKDGKNNITDIVDNNRTLKCLVSNREKRIITKQIAFNVFDFNIRRNPRNRKGNNSRYDHNE